MRHGIHAVVAVELVDTYTLRVTFNDGEIRTVDLGPVLEGEMYGPLRDPSLSAQVRIDPETRTLVWPNGADFDPETSHEWPERAAKFAAMARRWAGR